MKISIICPLYNAEKYIENLHKTLLMQKEVSVESINYILTECNDKTEEILNNLNLKYEKIKKEDFSHSKTREKYAVRSKGDILVFITQDIIIKDNMWLYNLVKDILTSNCEAAFSRQVCGSKGIESYIRPKNYPNKSRIVSKKDINQYGLMTFFFSDAASAIKKEVFVGLGGYDDKNLIISEDMYIAYKVIMNGYRIKYCADSVVIHSHKLTLKQLFNRYFDTGVFLKENEYLDKYSANKSGFHLAKYVISSAFKQWDYRTLFIIIPNFASRFIGMKLGKNYNKLPKNFVKKFSLNKAYWKTNS